MDRKFRRKFQPRQEMTDTDLDLIYVLVPNEVTGERDPKTIRQLTDREFREWIVPFASYNGVQVLPSLGRIGMETRLAMINRLIRQGVHIAKLSSGPGTPPLH